MLLFGTSDEEVEVAGMSNSWGSVAGGIDDDDDEGTARLEKSNVVVDGGDEAEKREKEAVAVAGTERLEKSNARGVDEEESDWPSRGWRSPEEEVAGTTPIGVITSSREDPNAPQNASVRAKSLFRDGTSGARLKKRTWSVE